MKLLVSAGLVFAAWAVAADADWPGWRGAQRDGISAETGLLKAWPEGGPKLDWKASGLGAGFSSVSIRGNRIYTMGDLADGQHVMALNLSDGQRVWSTRIGPVWEDEETGGPRGTPTVDGDGVYAISTEGDVVCLDAASGAIRWQRSIPRDYNGRMMSDWKFSESPLVDGERVIFTPGSFGALMVAVDKKTGKDLWRTGGSRSGTAGSNGAGYSSVVISNAAGVKQYVQLIGRGLIGVRAGDGKLLWSYNRVANDVANIATPVVRGDYVFASTGYGTGSVLLKLERSADGGVEAKEQYFLQAGTFQNHHGGFVLVGDTIYGGQGHNNGFPIAVEFATGKVRWGGNIRPEGATGSAAVGYADGRLYFRYQNGMMKLIDASTEGYHESGSFRIPGARKPSWSHPVIHDGKLFLREQDTLLCYRIR